MQPIRGVNIVVAARRFFLFLGMASSDVLNIG